MKPEGHVRLGRSRSSRSFGTVPSFWQGYRAASWCPATRPVFVSVQGGPSSVRKRGCYPRPVVFKTPGERGYGPPSEWSTLSSGDTWSERVGVPPPPSELFASPFPTSLSGNGFVQVTTSSAAQAFEGDRPSLSPCWAFPAADYCLRGRRLYRGGSASDSESLSRPSGIAVASGFESSSAMLCS